LALFFQIRLITTKKHEYHGEIINDKVIYSQFKERHTTYVIHMLSIIQN